jgi:hypothetical protein
MNPNDRFILAQDASQITDKHTGAVYSTKDAMKILFAKEGDQSMPSRFLRSVLAQDQSTIDPDMEPRGGYQAGNGTVPTVEELVAFVKLCLAKMSPEDKNDFLSQLADAAGEYDAGANDQSTGTSAIPYNRRADGVVNPNQSALDRSRRPARDNRGTRPAAMDSALQTLNHANFQRRWGPQTSHIKLNGNGR